MRPGLALLLALTPLLAPPAIPPTHPTAFNLDGLRDPAYVLVAEDPVDDLVPSVQINPGFQWADLTRLYLATDAANLYAYVDLPLYTQANSVGEIGLSIVFPAGTAIGPRIDALRSQISYAYSASSQGQCPAAGLPQTRHPDAAIRGYIVGKPGVANNPDTGATFVLTSTLGGWQGTETEWGGILAGQIGTHIAYSDGGGVELQIPWSDLGQAGPTDLHISFFTTAGGFVPGNFDAIPPDDQAAAALTDTILSQLATVALPLPEPQSVALGCATATVDEGAGTAELYAQLHTVLTETVAVSYTATALTAGPADFTPVSGNLTFIAGDSRQIISVPITDDAAVEGPETFLVTLSNPTTITLAAPYTATVTIVDDDAAEHKVFVPLIRR